MKTLSSLLKILAAFIFMFCILPVLFIYLNYIFLAPVIDFPGATIIGYILLALGLLMVIHCAYTVFFKPRQASPTPQKLVVDGLYRYVRNPMYLGDLIIYLAIFFLFGNLFLLVLFLLASVFIEVMVVKREEPPLEKKFGAAYRSYFEKTPRWLPSFKQK